MKPGCVSLSVLLASALVVGCATPTSYRTSQDFHDRMAGVKRIGVLVAEARIMKLHAGGATELDPEASERCASCTGTAAVHSLGGRGYEAVALPLDDETRALLGDYLKVRGETGPPLPSNQEKTDGTPALAGAAQVCTRHGVDAIVFLRAVDHVSTGGRKAMMGALALIGVIGGQGMAYADLAAVDRTGTIVFYDRKAGPSYTLTDDKDVDKILGELVAGLPAIAGR